MIGHSGDDPDTLRAAAYYLERSIFANAADLNAAYRAGRLAYAEAIGQPVVAATGMRV